MEEILVESSFAPRESVARLAGQPRARLWSRWRLRLPEPAGGAAAAVADKLLRRGTLLPAEPALESRLSRAFGARLPEALRWAHRLELAAVRAGSWAVGQTDLAGRLSAAGERALREAVNADLDGLRERLGRLWPGPAAARPITLLGAHESADCALVEDGWPNGAAGSPWLPASAERPGSATEGDLLYFARLLFGHERLRPGQADAVARLLAGRDALLLSPTGSGKSLVYQLAGLLRPGTALIAQPLLALLEDQRRSLERAGICAAAALAGGRAVEGARELAAGRLAFCLVSPERLESAAFREAARRCAAGPGFGLAVIDEAHCLSEWGHDFRPSYLTLGRRLARWAGGPAGRPPLLACTGTADGKAARGIAERLGIAETLTRAAGRPELCVRLSRCAPPRRLGLALELIARERFTPGLLFCQAVDGPEGAAAAAESLLWRENVETGCFTGRPPAGRDPRQWEALKRRDAELFLGRRLPWLCCTSAFGLGVHREDVRLTVHLGLPPSLEELSQQAGRAGRDGRAARAYLLAWIGPERQARGLLAPSRPLTWLSGALDGAARDDVSLALRRHLAGFPGAESERRGLRLLLSGLGPLRRGQSAPIEWPGASGESLARLLSRLELAGVAESERAGGIRLRALADLDARSALAAAEAEIERVYRDIEPARRASLRELVELCLRRDADEALTERIARGV